MLYRCDLTRIFAFFIQIITLKPCRKEKSGEKHALYRRAYRGIGSGKSTIAQAFAASGVEIIDADLIAREVVEPGTPALQAIQARYGTSIVTDEGKLDRSRLRDIIFQQPEEKAG